LNEALPTAVNGPEARSVDTKSWIDVCLVALGGSLGAVLRHFSGLLLNREDASLPFGTLAANLAGCFLIGLMYGWGLMSGPSRTRALLATGFLGALTTMSAFSIETWAMADSGNRWSALIYLGMTLIGCIAFAAIGAMLGRWMSPGMVPVESVE
jgi:CrcB protein